MEEAGDARPDDVDEVGDGDLLVVEEVHSEEEALAELRHIKWFHFEPCQDTPARLSSGS